MRSYPLFSKRNLPAYGLVMAAWIAASLLLAMLLLRWTGTLAVWAAIAWSALATLTGMMIMFGASWMNLRRLGPGFRRLAQGASDPRIPPVWCPVLTAATNAALELAAARRGAAPRPDDPSAPGALHRPTAPPDPS